MLTNEELKKKIVDITQMKLQECPFQPIGITYGEAAEYVADALIAAGLRFGENFTATFDLMALEREHELEHRLAEAEYRAEVAEKMFDILHEESSMYMKVFSKEWYKQQAEKELMEERKK